MRRTSTLFNLFFCCFVLTLPIMSCLSFIESLSTPLRDSLVQNLQEPHTGMNITTTFLKEGDTSGKSSICISNTVCGQLK